MNPIAMMLSKSAGSLALKLSFLSVAVIGGASLVSSNVFAALTATASNTAGGGLTTGTLSLTLETNTVSGITGGFSTAISAMGPGDTVNRYITLRNGGSLDGETPTLRITAETATTLTTNASTGLAVVISRCAVLWLADGTCTGGSTTVLTTTANALTLGEVALSLPSTGAGTVNYLKIGITLPTSSEITVNGVFPNNTIQGLNTRLTWTFTVAQRTAATTNS